jgi:ubiquinone/menaquinone biosynthesis C-methylase UbiE
MLNRARERFKADPHITFKPGTAEFLPVESGSFDVVACNNAFHLVQDAAAAMREFHRALRSGGRVILIDWCRDAPQMKAMALALKLADRQVRRMQSMGGLASMMEEHGFTVTHRERFRVPPMWGLMAVVAERA